MKLSIQRMVVLLSVALVLLTALALSTASIIQTNGFADGVQADLDGMTDERINQSANSVRDIVRTQGDALAQRVESDLRVTQAELDDAGGFRTGGGSVTWQAKNQATQEITTVKLPRAQVGDTWFGQVTDPKTRVPVVDDAKDLIGDTATIFQRMNARGDMLRVATNIANQDGKRVIGTYIPVENADGGKNAVLDAVLAGKTYVGTANVVGSWYVTRYAPIKDASGAVIGMSYAGVKQESVTTLRDAVLGARVGEHGRVLTLGTTGPNKGMIRFADDTALQGQSALETTDANGKAYLAEAVDAAAKLDENGSATVQFVDPQGGPSTVHVAYYKPWDWTIATITRDSDFAGPAERLAQGRRGLIAGSVVISIVVVAAALALAWYLGRRITRPITVLRDRMAEIADGDGDLTQRVDEHDRDEVGQLGGAFNRFAGKVAGTIATVSNASRGVSASTGEIVALTRELDTSAAESARQAASARSASEEVGQSVEGAAAATEEMSTSIREIAGSAARAAEVGSEAAQLAADTEAVVTTLGESSAEISQVVKTINAIAEQTNLLALNATIEAARAGDAGKGFAVVAGEVKDLAHETSAATDDIGRRIEAIQADTLRAVDAITRIATVVRDINDAQATIAAAVEEQSATTAEVSRSIQHAATGVEGIRRAIGVVDASTASSAEALRTARASTDQLNELVDELGRDLSGFTI
ncbi:methyl-accepting chemotaxis protein [Mobilicoccus massiliensis]|uniref:methyl-accepting chemotaxis protein n=1 Tax=Mobilicoccus massiliensis TaxID=1522310 RepID=UPI00058FB3B8|nr:methyl-accepting chemotaxis protein [Mobilicoccus massiliensis]